MLVISWNVAGLGTTVNRIHEVYGKPAGYSQTGASKSTKTTTASPSFAFAQFLERHGADILCVQEAKIPRQQLSNRCEPRGISTVAGYESFWSCCVDPEKKGFNGVATFARIGTVQSADCSPLGVPDLDQQGRCVMTDHGTFLLFNVYVPASGGLPLSQKMRFLRALQRSMQERRLRYNKPVILAGDLNIALSERDIYWKDRVVYVNDIRAEVTAAESDSTKQHELPLWKLQLAEHWESIEEVMKTKEVIQTQTTNSHTKETYEKFRLSVTLSDKRRVFLGKHETAPEYCLHCYDFEEFSYWDEETGKETLAHETNGVRIQVLAELMQKIAGVEWCEEEQRQIASGAQVCRVSPTRQWLKDLLRNDDMVDVFRHFYPNAEARFTCWHQFTNRRYVNDGSRIDFIIVDRDLLKHAQPGTPLRTCDSKISGKNIIDNPLSEESALRAATANGRFQPAAYEGGGIQEATQDALDTQFGPAHTGMIYTPPTFSDHIAISVLFEDSILPRDLNLDGNNVATRKAQPHKLQKSIASFFGNVPKGERTNGARRTSSSSVNSSSSSAKKLKTSKKPPVNSILNHFHRQSG